MIWIILLLIWAILAYTHPWIDVFKDYRGTKHIVLWYTNFKGERVFINLKGGQEE